MIYRNVELHNVEELVTQEDGSVLLQRVPEDVRCHLNENAQGKMRWAAGCELRFVIEGGSCEVTLSAETESIWGFPEIMIFFGEYQHYKRYRIGPEPVTITLEPDVRLHKAAAPFVKNEPFNRRVCRIRFDGNIFRFHGISGNVRPPEPAELPAKRLLMYGTSITQGAGSTGAHLAYAAVTARKLGMDLINLGSGGSCMCEPEKADYIAARTDWDAAVLALSVNMRGWAIDAFAERVSYVVNTVAAVGKPVACITLWPHFGDMTDADGNDIDPGAASTAEYRQALRDAVANCPYPNVTLLEGPELFTDTSGLTGDLIHPGDYGMIEMGTNLAAAMKKILD